MILQEQVESACPSCGEIIQLLIDTSIPQQEYIEDCQVCCRPMRIIATVDSEEIPGAVVYNEDE